MHDPNETYQDDLDSLLSQVDALLLDNDFEQKQDDFDVDDYAPADDYDEPVLIQNYSNRYGAARQEPEPERPVIPAYNADYRRPDTRQTKPRNLDETRVIRYQEDLPRQERSPAPPDLPRREHRPAPPDLPAYEETKKRKKRKKPGCIGCGCMGLLMITGVLALCLTLAFSWLFARPESDQPIGARKKDTATVLICGTDADGTRTDTMMLLYMSGSEKQVGLLSLPRDTYTITSAGYGAKLNSAYGRNGTGAEGMEGLLDYVQEIIGYRPDGYILVDMALVPKIVDLMGGLDVEVPMTFDLEGQHLEEGMQHLNGAQILQLLRFREGYAMQDLDRIEVQRSVISAAMEQWVSAAHIPDVGDALELVENNSLMNLNARNLLWMGKTILLNMKDLQSDTLPGYATYIGDGSYYVLYRQDVADLINARYNPYRETILAEDLKIAG